MGEGERDGGIEGERGEKVRGVKLKRESVSKMRTDVCARDRERAGTQEDRLRTEKGCESLEDIMRDMQAAREKDRRSQIQAGTVYRDQ